MIVRILDSGAAVTEFPLDEEGSGAAQHSRPWIHGMLMINMIRTHPRILGPAVVASDWRCSKRRIKAARREGRRCLSSPFRICTMVSAMVLSNPDLCVVYLPVR